MYPPDVLASYSRDRRAAGNALRLREEANRAGPWRPRRARTVRQGAEEAQRAALAAGLDWRRLPHPPAGLRAPDRSARRRLGRRFPPPGSPVPPSLRSLLRSALAASRSDPPPATGPPPAGPVAPDGGGVAAMAGRPLPGELSGPAARDWLAAGPAPAYAAVDGGAWFEAPDGGLWYRDPGGRGFALAADGRTLLPLSGEGLLYARETGSWRTALSDGTPLRLRGDGQLVAEGPGGVQHLLADDGLFYLVTPVALYPVTASGDVLLDQGIAMDGSPVAAPGADGAAAGFDDGGELFA